MAKSPQDSEKPTDPEEKDAATGLPETGLPETGLSGIGLSGTGLPETPKDDADTGGDAVAGDASDGDAPRRAGDDDADAAEERRAALDAALAASPLVASGAAPASAEPAPAGGGARDQDAHDHDEESHRSLASKALTGLILLLVGGALALWAGPRVAPHLPSGLGAVKAWLMPGEAMSVQRIAEVEAALSARIDGIAAGIDADTAAAQAEAAAAAVEARLEERLAALADQVAAADSASIESRLATVEGRLEGLAAELASVETGAAAPAALGEADLAVIEGLRAELGALADRQGAISQRIDDVEAAVARRLSEAEAEVAAAEEAATTVRSAALSEAALTAMRAALGSGEPYAEALASFEENSGAAVPEGLRASAEGGVATLGTLRTAFADAAHQAIRAVIRAEGGSGLAGRFGAFLEAQVATRSLTPQEGSDADAILSRAEDALRRDNLTAALDELGALPEPALAAMEGWIARAEARLAAQAGLAELSAAGAVN
ncbi:hypothetical protein HMH01_02310 [Halovulum dunhuangense]|uniref:Inner membrane protein n=1 Tax=Halovulum dunhuangense TaxID=1505036 RepID=A0A849L058_9RHOB|nr:hypothetical protein [Halovulum dunhuangense]NNU79260.1 hypothetical protein [Halovulum dunhuangense]